MSAETEARLVYMANQIARNFAAQGDEAAIKATADHIRLFWDPRMKEQIVRLDQTGLSDIASKAIATLAAGAD